MLYLTQDPSISIISTLAAISIMSIDVIMLCTRCVAYILTVIYCMHYASIN